MSSYRMLSRCQSVPTVKPWYSTLFKVLSIQPSEVSVCLFAYQHSLLVFFFCHLHISNFYMSTFLWGVGLLLFQVAVQNVVAFYLWLRMCLSLSTLDTASGDCPCATGKVKYCLVLLICCPPAAPHQCSELVCDDPSPWSCRSKRCFCILFNVLCL